MACKFTGPFGLGCSFGRAFTFGTVSAVFEVGFAFTGGVSSGSAKVTLRGLGLGLVVGCTGVAGVVGLALVGGSGISLVGGGG